MYFYNNYSNVTTSMPHFTISTKEKDSGFCLSCNSNGGIYEDKNNLPLTSIRPIEEFVAKYPDSLIYNKDKLKKVIEYLLTQERLNG